MRIKAIRPVAKADATAEYIERTTKVIKGYASPGTDVDVVFPEGPAGIGPWLGHFSEGRIEAMAVHFHARRFRIVQGRRSRRLQARQRQRKKKGVGHRAFDCVLRISLPAWRLYRVLPEPKLPVGHTVFCACLCARHGDLCSAHFIAWFCHKKRNHQDFAVFGADIGRSHGSDLSVPSACVRGSGRDCPRRIVLRGNKGVVASKDKGRSPMVHHRDFDLRNHTAGIADTAMKETIYLGSDHAGFDLKEKLKEYLKKKYRVRDLGPWEYVKTDDYPDYAIPVAKLTVKTGGKGILVCGSAEGICIAANKVKGARAVPVWSVANAKLSREHNDANILSLGARFLEDKEAKETVKLWLETPFSKEERHTRRIKKIDQ